MSSNVRPTLRDVAAEAGVSHMTVARVVNGTSPVAPATRKAVEAALQKLHYRPDPALSALSAYRRQTGGHGSVLALIDCDRTAYSGKVFSGANTEAHLLGYASEIFPLPTTQEEHRRLSHILLHRGIQGVLFGPSHESRDIESWDWSNFCPVSLDALSHEPPMHAVAMDYFLAAFQAVKLLRARGLKRLGLAVDARSEKRTGHRWQGGALAARANMQIYPEAVTSPKSLRRWMKTEKLEGILTIHTSVSEVASALGLTTIFLNDFDCPSGMTRCALEPASIGREGVRLAHHLLLRGEKGLPDAPRTVSLQGKWIEHAI